MDLQGVHDLMPSAVATGKVQELEERILACYRFKTGVPAACFAAMGAVLGGGTKRQITAISDYLEAAGIAFQIIDDVLNLTGFERGQKTVGEDVFNGTVTLPTVRALAELDLRERRDLWAKYQAASDDPTVVPGIIDTLERCDSFRSCRTTAQALIDDEWRVLETALEPSHATVVLRAFSWFVIERHY
jgi:geranylgeranyl pyrophosphate synthase